MPENILDASATAVLGFIAVALVFGVLALLRRKNGNGNAPTEEQRERVMLGLAYIAEHDVAMPENWRRMIEERPFSLSQQHLIDERILHKNRSEKMLIGVALHLLKQGHTPELQALLESLKDE